MQGDAPALIKNTRLGADPLLAVQLWSENVLDCKLLRNRRASGPNRAMSAAQMSESPQSRELRFSPERATLTGLGLSWLSPFAGTLRPVTERGEKKQKKKM